MFAGARRKQGFVAALSSGSSTWNRFFAGSSFRLVGPSLSQDLWKRLIFRRCIPQSMLKTPDNSGRDYQLQNAQKDPDGEDIELSLYIRTGRLAFARKQMYCTLQADVSCC